MLPKITLCMIGFFDNVSKGHEGDQNISLSLSLQIYCYHKIKLPFSFGASKATLIGVERDVVGCGGDHYASTPSTLMVKGCLVTTMKIDFHLHANLVEFVG
jgi:hypothetical protein